MKGTRVRSLLAAAAIWGVFAYGIAGHALRQPMSHDDMAGAAVGLCLLLASAIAVLAAARPADRLVAAPASFPEPGAPPGISAPSDGRARASPVALQRFRN